MNLLAANLVTGLLPTILVLGILILIHEFGHFVACRLTGVKVEKFSIGFGPEIFHFQGKETRYVVSLLPFGGFVKPAGEAASVIGAEGPRPGDYLGAPILKRIFIVVAGVGMNYLLSFVLFAAIFLMGRPVPLAQIGGFVSGYPAETSGLRKGDRILAVNGAQVDSWEGLTGRLGEVTESEVDLDIRRREEALRLRVPVKMEPVQDVFGKTHRLPRMGILPDPEAFRVEKLGPRAAIKEAFLTEFHLTGMTYKAIFFLATGQLSLKTVSGPIGIMTMTGTAAKMGLVYVLHLMAVLGISLAVINLMPIPALDGGHLIFLLIEAVFRRSVSPEIQERATQVGFALLMVLMVFVLYNDLANLQIFGRLKAVFAH